jgi:hypothetical protein
VRRGEQAYCFPDSCPSCIEMSMQADGGALGFPELVKLNLEVKTQKRDIFCHSVVFDIQIVEPVPGLILDPAPSEFLISG